MVTHEPLGYGRNDVAYDQAWLIFMGLDAITLVAMRLAGAGWLVLSLLAVSVSYQAFLTRLEPFSTLELTLAGVYQPLYLVWLALFVGTLVRQARRCPYPA